MKICYKLLSTSFLFLFLIQLVTSQCADVPMSILNGTTGLVVEGNENQDDLGYSVKGAGDVNGDGVDDMIIGAPNVDYGGIINVGEAYVIFGRSGTFDPIFDKATLDGSNGFIIRGAVANGQLGVSVSIAGDINNDGFDDVLIGDLGEDVLVIFGSESDFLPVYNKSDINGTNGIIIQKSGSGLGQYLSYAGDVNDDDIDDIVISDSSESAVVIFGSSIISNINASALNGNNGFVIEKLLQSDAGLPRVSSAGDINKDGNHDIILGFPFYDEGGDVNAGRVYVVHGKSTDYAASIALESLDALDGFFISGYGSHSHYGHSVSAAKDFNNDGTDDFIIGAPGMYGDREFYQRNGRAYVIYGRSIQFPANNAISDFDGSNSFTIYGDESYDELGTAVDGLSDINGDGISDIIVSAVGGGIGSQGAGYIIYGSNTPSESIQADNIWGNIGYQVFDDTPRGFSNQELGYSVSDIGDFNDDGFNDFMLGAIRKGSSNTEKGRAYIFFGRTFTMEDSELPVILCPGDKELHINSTLPNYSFFLQDVTDNCTEGWELTFTQSPPQGTVFNGDTEVTVSVSDRSGNSTSCSFWVRAKTEVVDISCSPEPFSVKDIDETDGIVIYGGKAMGSAGFDVDHAGDINGDGIDDFIIGAKGHDYSWVGPYEIPYHIMGTAHVVFGTDSGFPPNIDLALLNGNNGFTIQNDKEFRQFQEFGTAVSGAGDIDGDGIDDIIISDPSRIDSSGSRLGDVFIIFGTRSDFPAVLNTSDLNGSNGFNIKGSDLYGSLGSTIDNIGDFNDDGRDDIAIITGGYGADPGKCYIIYGTSSNFPSLITVDQINGTNGITIMGGPGASDYISTSVAGLGDVNGDNIDDIAIAGRHPNTKKYIIYGSGSPSNLVVTDLDDTNCVIVDHSEEENLTRVVTRAGDVNGDGFNDIIFGHKHVLFGGNSLDSSIDLADLNGENGFSLFTTSSSVMHLEYAGDFNKDEIDDLVLVLGEFLGNEANAYVIYGKPEWGASIVPNSFTFLDALTIDLDLYGLDSRNVSGSYAGDVNRDGIDDVIVGTVNDNFRFKINSDPGFAFVIFGREITDTEVPEITCPDNQVLPVGEVLPDYTIHVDIEVSDNCTAEEDIVITQSPAPGSVYTPGMTITLTATDISGNEGSCTFIVSDLADTEAPEITCPGTQILAIGNELPDYTSMATVTDNEDPSPVVTQNPAPGSAFTPGMTITLTVTDASGNESDCTFTVNASADTEVPEITCPGTQELAVGNVLSDYTSMATVTDNEDPSPAVTQNPAPGSAFTPGMSITLTATDASGNESDCTFIVNASADREAPVITCPDTQELAVGNVLPDYTSMATVTDNEDPSPAVTQAPAPGSAFTPGMTITLTATDASGNESDCTFIVNASADTEAPEITCPGTQVLAIGNLLPDYTSLAGVTDNEDTSPAVTQNPAPGSAFTPGMAITLTATDASGNESDCMFIVNASADTEAPVITCPGTQELAVGNVLMDYTSLVSVTDNEDPGPAVTQNPAPGSAFTPGMSITLTATDASGNESDCTFTVNSSADTEAPVITCPGTQELAVGNVLPDYTSMATVTDNEDPGPAVTQNPTPGSAFTPGMSITLTATDASGNESDCTFTVNASADTEAPVITCPGTQELAVGNVLMDYTSLVSVTDNEDTGPVVTQAPAQGEAFIPGMTITLTATDASGNESDCTFTVNALADTEAPEITCPGNQEVPCGTLVVADYTTLVNVTDNEDPDPVVIQDPEPGSNFIPGMSIMLIGIDESGNSSECTFIVNFEESASIDAGEDVTITEGNEVTLNANSNQDGTYEWSPDSDLNNAFIANPVANPRQTTTYTVTFVSQDGCTATDEVTVFVNELPEDETKYGLSPNNDGKYDFWEIKGIEAYPDNKVQIYNRWGDVVFEVEGYDNTSNFFEGKANRLTALGAGDLPNGTYFFKIHINGQHLLRKTEGYIILKR